MGWTQKELEELYKKANEKALNDPEFAKKIKENAEEALKEIAGKDLPQGFKLKMVDGDSKYAAAYLTPDFAGGELNLNDLKSVAGGEGEPSQGNQDDGAQTFGVSAVLIVSACGVAVDVGPCGGDACGGAACAAEACGGAACGGEACVGEIVCAADACGGAACVQDIICAAEACGAYVCGGDVVCAAEACGTDACGGNIVCAGEACGAEACAAQGPCGGEACGAEACTSHAE